MSLCVRLSGGSRGAAGNGGAHRAARHVTAARKAKPLDDTAARKAVSASRTGVFRIAAHLVRPRQMRLQTVRSKKIKAWLAKQPQVHFHYTPTSASWLNQVKGFFGILGKQSLSATDFRSKGPPRTSEGLHALVEQATFAVHVDETAHAIISSHRRMLDRISTPVH